HLTGVNKVGTPSTIASAALEQGATEFPVELRAMRTTEPAISAPLVTEGGWRRASDGAGRAGPTRATAPAGAVVEASFAAATNLRVGMRVNVVGVDGNTAAITVVGLAYTS